MTSDTILFYIFILKINAASVSRHEEKGVGLMNRHGIKGYLLIFLICLSACLSVKAWADDPYSTSTPLFTDQELDNLLAPIALYPDPLLAQILPASTYPAEIAEAYNWLSGGGPVADIDRQNWDESVKAIAHYPGILKMMAENGNWTADVGEAFLNQPEDVTRSIQRLRWLARDAGNLTSNSQQTVVIVGDYIEIIPTLSQYIYIPVYDPSVVYVQPWIPGRPPFVSFGLALAIGGWLSMDFDWANHHVIYHGWNRTGWVTRARPYVKVRNVYINRSRPFINQAWRHDRSHGSPEGYRGSHPGGSFGVTRQGRLPEIRGSVMTPPKPVPKVFGPKGDTGSFSNRGRESRGVVPSRQGTSFKNIQEQPKVSAPSISKQPVITTPGVSRQPARPIQSTGRQPLPPKPDSSKVIPQIRPARESVQPSRTPSVTFGGYRGASETREQSQRGQNSRQSREAAHSPTAPATKNSAPQRKDSTRSSTPFGKADSKGKEYR